jgi:serine/threonine protein kinase
LQKTPSSSSATNPLYPKGFRRKSSTNSAGAPNSGERSYFDLIPESAFDEDDEGDDMPLMKLTEEDKQVLMESLKEVEIDYQQLELLDTIGEGAFGKVHKGVLMLPAYQPQLGYTKTLVAVKTIKSYSTKDELKSFLRESALMKHFNHPNVLGLIGICLNTPEHVPYIVLPFMANGDLRSFLRTKRGGRTSVSQMPNGLTVEQLLLICHQISCGMAYLAESKFVHRDLAARNCMIDDDLNVKVADFGLTRDIYMVDYYKQARLGRVPVKWMAPESLFDRVYNNKTDVWSFGVTCWEVFSLGRTPYAGMANHEIGPYLEKGGRLSKPPLCPDNMYEVIRWCWDGIPDHRPSFRTLADDIRNLVPENYHNV